MWTPEARVRLVTLPDGVRGTVLPNEDGDYDVYLNDRYPPEQRQKTLEHELRHIRLAHFSDDRPLSELEEEADGRETIPCFDSLDSLARTINL